MNKTIYSANTNTYLIINNGARVLQNKYHEFAKYISLNNITVITYDYSDMLLQKEKLKKSDVSIKNWANHDFKDVIEYVSNLNKNSKIFVLGHSLGGQIIGLTDNCSKIDGIILVAAQTGYWKYWKFPINILNYLTWNLYVPITLKLYNYLPKGINNNLSDMPKKAVLDWIQWCKSKNYLFDIVPKDEQHYYKITCPVLSISFSHDIYATKEAVDWLSSQYFNAEIIRKHYVSNENKFGHSAAFEPSNFHLIGSDIVNFIKRAS